MRDRFFLEYAALPGKLEEPQLGHELEHVGRAVMVFAHELEFGYDARIGIVFLVPVNKKGCLFVDDVVRGDIGVFGYERDVEFIERADFVGARIVHDLEGLRGLSAAKEKKLRFVGFLLGWHEMPPWKLRLIFRV